MANIKRNIIFSLENRKKDGVPVVENVPIRMRVIFLNNRVDFSTGYRIDAAKWDFDMQKVKNGCTNKLKQTASDINTDLKKYETQIQDIFKAFEIKNIIPTPDLLKQEFNTLNKQSLPDSKQKSKSDFKKAFEEFNTENGRQNNWTKSTFQKFESVKVHLSDFKSDLTFDYFDEKGINNFIVLGFEYVLAAEGLFKLRIEAKDFLDKEKLKNSNKKGVETEPEKDLLYFLKHNHGEYFRIIKKSIEYNTALGEENDENFIDLEKEKIGIKEIINFKFISAKRDVSNKEIDKTLSSQTSTIYKKTEASDDQKDAIDDFKDKLRETDIILSGIYSKLFESVINKVKSFGGIKEDDSLIEIISTLQHKELLEGNTTVMYNHSGNSLPEHYNGLGYMNLISMIFEIEILIQDFKKKKDEKPSDINLLFIEEPEAHTHPQMQYVFIKNIKSLLGQGITRDDGLHSELQSIISTHSSHIVSESDFDDIKYLTKVDDNSVIAKNLKELKNEYSSSTNQYEFLKQYLTINRAEIFFADKAILIEGDTERILFPTLMRKFDIDEKKKHLALGKEDNYLPLLSQNISVIEVGAYSHIFEKFIDFIGTKTLIITDLDTTDANDKKCEPSVGVNFSNDALSFFFSSPTLELLKGNTIENKTFLKTAGVWSFSAIGRLCVVYQTLENGFNARSFEDAFIHLNRNFITPIKADFKGLQNRSDFDDITINAYELAENCIKKKTHFALDILYHSNQDFSNWEIPSYIKEGLSWLKQD